MHPKTRKGDALPFSPPFFYGWVISIISALILFFSGPGQTYSVSIFIEPIIQDFNWTRSIVSSMYSIGTLTAGLLIGFMGNLFDKKGHRIMTTLVILGLGLACIWMGFVQNIIMLSIGFFLIRLLGQGSMSLASMTLTPQWFIKNRGKALSLVSFGGTLGSVLLPPINALLIQNFGWRNGWRFWTLLLCLIMAPISYFLIRNKPEDVGLLPDNQIDREIDTDTILEENWTLNEAVRTRAFWLLMFCLAVPSAILTGLIFHQVSVMKEIGITAELAALVLSTMAMVRIPILFIAGQLADRIQPRLLMAVNQFLLLSAIVMLYFANDIQLALIYGGLSGLMMGLQSIMSGVIWPDYFGRRYLSSIRGVTMMAGVIGSSLGPLPFGFAYDLFGGYNEILLISLIFPTLGVMAALLAKKPIK
jgi:MFS family permease